MEDSPNDTHRSSPRPSIVVQYDSASWSDNDQGVPNSVDDAINEESDNNVSLPEALRYVPRLLRFDDAPPEATGLSVDMWARAAVLMASIFLGPALLHLATEAAEAQCNTTDNKEENCDDVRVYGMKPSSLLSNIAIASGLLGSFMLPIFGAVVDHTPYRRQVGAVSAALLAVVKGVEVIVSSRTWFFVAILQVVSGILFQVHVCATFAYTSELTTNPQEQTKYNTFYTCVLYLSTLVFLVEVLVLAFSLNTDDVGTARISQIITCATACVCFGFAWSFCFRDRPSLSRVPEGSTLMGCGFRKVFQTTKMIWSELPALKWFMMAVVFNESATATLITIATTYMSHYLEMDATEIGVVFVVVLLMGIPGSKLGEKVALKYNPVISARICVVFFIITTTVAAWLLTGPDDKQFTVIFGAWWGLCLGWLHPMDSIIFITIIPKGQETELMGMYIFCGQVLSWLPPLLFTILNESGVEMSIGLASLNVFFVLGLACLLLMGSYDKALDYGRMRSNDDCEMDSNVSSAEPDDGTGDIALSTIT